MTTIVVVLFTICCVIAVCEPEKAIAYFAMMRYRSAFWIFLDRRLGDKKEAADDIMVSWMRGELWQWRFLKNAAFEI